MCSIFSHDVQVLHSQWLLILHHLLVEVIQSLCQVLVPLVSPLHWEKQHSLYQVLCSYNLVEYDYLRRLCFLFCVEIVLYFINETPLLVGGSVYAEFEANRDGLDFYCHLTHFDAYDFRENCKCNVFANVTCLQTHHIL